MLATTQPHLQRPADGTLYNVLDLILDKGLVIDAYVRVSLVGIELLTVDARVVVASVDTYLRFAERADRLVIGKTEKRDIGNLLEGGAKEKTRGALRGGAESLREATAGASHAFEGRASERFGKVKSKLRDRMEDVKQAIRRDGHDDHEDDHDDDEGEDE